MVLQKNKGQNSSLFKNESPKFCSKASLVSKINKDLIAESNRVRTRTIQMIRLNLFGRVKTRNI